MVKMIFKGSKTANSVLFNLRGGGISIPQVKAAPNELTTVIPRPPLKISFSG
jgi:hypothetical protein